jgi:chromosomal replication initiator protein
MTPVLFYGPCGVGKTHLISAIVQQLRSHCRMRRVVHMTSEQFTNDFTEAIKGGGLPLFRRKYRDVEALIVDDVHFLVGKKATLGEFKHTVDNLLRLGKQVILTADRSLNDLQGLGNDVVGRLRGGLVSPLMPIDEKTRSALLQREIDKADIKIPAEVVSQIAARTVGDGRVLQGIVKRLIAVASQAAVGLTWDQCWNSVYDLVQATQPVVRLGDIERVVCEVFGLAPTSLQSASKTRTIAQPRMLAMFLARKYTPAAYKEIGDYFGNRRHSTVISAERTVEEWLRDNMSLGDERGLTVRDAIRHVESHLQVG